MSVSRLHTDGALLGYFHDALHAASRNQRLAPSDASLHYLSRLLTDYARSERLFDEHRDGRRVQPLALLYRDALKAPSPGERRLLLQRLGDVALFLAGVFGGRLQRRLVDLDYCMRMGAGAYGHLGELAPPGRQPGAVQAVFRELAGGFTRFVGLVAEIGAQRFAAEQDPVRLWASWERSRDPRLAARLAALGLAPVALDERRH